MDYDTADGVRQLSDLRQYDKLGRFSESMYFSLSLYGDMIEQNTKAMWVFIKKHPSLEQPSFINDHKWAVTKGEVFDYIKGLPLQELRDLKDGDVLECCVDLKPSVCSVEDIRIEKIKHTVTVYKIHFKEYGRKKYGL